MKRAILIAIGDTLRDVYLNELDPEGVYEFWCVDGMWMYTVEYPDKEGGVE